MAAVVHVYISFIERRWTGTELAVGRIIVIRGGNCGGSLALLGSTDRVGREAVLSDGGCIARSCNWCIVRIDKLVRIRRQWKIIVRVGGRGNSHSHRHTGCG